MVQFRKDIWRPLIAIAPLDQIIRRRSLESVELRWLPSPGPLRYFADPFAYWRDDRLHVFVEAFDYRDAVGVIDVLIYDAQFRLIEHQPVLREPWHLSYPHVFEADGALWMLPEASASGGLTLYRAIDFPLRWAAAARIALDHVPVDATPFHDQGRWWLFYSSADRPRDILRTLHLAHASDLTGPWTPHPMNPVRVDLAGARPGGTPVMVDDQLVFPVQDCTRTYGGAIRLLGLDRLSTDGFRACDLGTIEAPDAVAPFMEGLHTLSAAGPVTLIDVKRRQFSLEGLAMRPLRDLRRLRARLQAQ